MPEIAHSTALEVGNDRFHSGLGFQQFADAKLLAQGYQRFSESCLLLLKMASDGHLGRRC
jgi:hypothetical protein